MGPRNRVGIGLSYRPTMLRWLVELIPWNRFLGSIKFKNSGSVEVLHWKIPTLCLRSSSVSSSPQSSQHILYIIPLLVFFTHSLPDCLCKLTGGGGWAKTTAKKHGPLPYIPIKNQTYGRAKISAVELIRHSQLLQAFRVRCGSETERRLRWVENTISCPFIFSFSWGKTLNSSITCFKNLGLFSFFSWSCVSFIKWYWAFEPFWPWWC